MGILLVSNILDELKSLTDLFNKGNPIIWGWLGWCVFLLCIMWVGYQLYKCYIRKYLELIQTKAVCTSEKERYRVQLDREKLDKEKRRGEYEKKKERTGKRTKRIKK